MQPIDPVIQRKIFNRLATLPSDHLLRKCWTEPQIETGVGLRLRQTLIAVGWLAEHRGLDNPLKPLVASGQMDKADYTLIMREVSHYNKLWALIYASFENIRIWCEKAQKGSFPFDSAFNLFSDIAAYPIDTAFEDILNPYRVIKGRSRAEGLSLLVKTRKRGFTTPIEDLKIRDTFSQELKNNISWMTVVLIVCQTEAKRDLVIKERLEDYEVSLNRRASKAATIARKLGSFAWIDGIPVSGDKFGGTYTKS